MQSEIIRDTRRRLTACFTVASLNFMVLMIPRLAGGEIYLLVTSGILLNLISAWRLLRGVKPMMNEVEHLSDVALSKRWTMVIGFLGTVAVLFSGFQGLLDRQVVPFLVCGYLFLLVVPAKIMNLAVARRMEDQGGR